MIRTQRLLVPSNCGIKRSHCFSLNIFTWDLLKKLNPGSGPIHMAEKFKTNHLHICSPLAKYSHPMESTLKLVSASSCSKRRLVLGFYAHPERPHNQPSTQTDAGHLQFCTSTNFTSCTPKKLETAQKKRQFPGIPSR